MNAVQDDVPSSEESSLAEPTAEELAIWQAQQFKKGQVTLHRLKEQAMDPIQKRRLALRHGHECANHTALSSGSDDDYDWEAIAGLPDLQNQSSVFFHNFNGFQKDVGEDDVEVVVLVGIAPVLRTLATSPEGDPELLGTTWHRLYSSVEGDGLSFLSLSHEICNYDGPTLLLLKVNPSKTKLLSSSKTTKKATATIGFYTTTTWQESSKYFGNSSAHDKAFLFAMSVEDNVVEFFNMQDPTKRRRANPAGYMYCHPSTISTKSRGAGKRNVSIYKTDGAVHGIGVGGKPSQPRFHLTESLEECRCLTYDSSGSFQDGNLFLNNPAFEDSLYYFDVETIEVWGVGGKAWIQHALDMRNKARGIAASELDKRRRIKDKSQLLDDFRSGLHSMTAQSASNHSYFDHVVYTSNRCDL